MTWTARPKNNPDRKAPAFRPPLPMLLGFGVVLALLASLPIIAAATGALNNAPQYTLMQNVPERGDGAYLQVDDGTRRGIVKLYAWNFQLNEFPADAPTFNPAHVSALIISQRGIDDVSRYHLFRLDDQSTVMMDANAQVTKIIFSPRAPLADGKYLLDMPKSGLSSDRQYLYFRLDASATTLPVK
jgi:hypothetical protein